MSKELKWYSFRWRVLFIIFGILLLFGCYAGYRGVIAFRMLPMGEGPAGPAIEAGDFEKVWSEGKVVFIGIGDSITRGLGAGPRHTYFNLLVRNDDERFGDMAGRDLSRVFPNLEVYNFAQDYSVSQEHIDRQLPKIENYPDDVKGIVVITSGGNDLIHDYGRSPAKDGAVYGCSYEQGLVWTENIKQRIAKLIDGINEKFEGGCEIFLANIYDPTDGVSDPEKVGLPKWRDGVKVLDLTNDKIAKLCEQYENVHLVDIHSEFLGHGIHCLEFWRKTYRADDPHWWYYTNLEDPNPRGHDAIRRLFLLEICNVCNNQELIK